MRIIARGTRPELFIEEEKQMEDIYNMVEVVYNKVATATNGYDQRELTRELKEQGYSTYSVNIALSVLVESKRILSIVD